MCDQEPCDQEQEQNIDERKKAFDAGVDFAKTGKMPKIEDEEGFLALCKQAESHKTAVPFDEIQQYLASLLNREHNYNTIATAFVAGLSMCMKAMDKHKNGGITGFQASWIVNQFFMREQNVEGPAKFLKYSEMLYPQYEKKFTVLDKDVWEWLQSEAKKRLKRSPTAHDNVINHWRSIVEGEVPFGFTVALK
jgi:hypothetical protein